MFIMVISVFADNIDLIKQNNPDSILYEIKNFPEICSRLAEVRRDNCIELDLNQRQSKYRTDYLRSKCEDVQNFVSVTPEVDMYTFKGD